MGSGTLRGVGDGGQGGMGSDGWDGWGWVGLLLV